MAQLDDDWPDNQIQFESYERNRLRKEAAKSAATVNLSDEETSLKQGPGEDKAGEIQTTLKQAEQHPPIPKAGQTPSEEPKQSEQQQEELSGQQQQQQSEQQQQQ